MQNISDTNYIKKIAQIMEEESLNRVTVSQNGAEITLEKGKENKTTTPSPPVQTLTQTPAPPTSSDEEIKSPIVGIFYSSSAPDADPFVTIGQQVKKGDVLCIIEAMKLMNEITAEKDGKITDILVKNGDIVEYGTALFRIGE